MRQWKKSLLWFFTLLVAGCGHSGEQSQAGDPAITAKKARQLIASGKNLEQIPKNTWRQLLTPEQYDILWEKGTEKPFTGQLLNIKEQGVYVTAGCRLPVFHSDTKFESGTGWPSFWDVYDKKNIILKPDWAWGMKRTEVLSSCGEHLGHVFDDGPAPTGLRYCMNSLALDFVPQRVFDGAGQ